MPLPGPLSRTPAGRRGSRFWRLTVNRWNGTAELGIPLRWYVLRAAAVLAGLGLLALMVHILFFSPPPPPAPDTHGSGYVKAPRSIVSVVHFASDDAGAMGLVSISLVILAIVVLIVWSVVFARRRNRICFDRGLPFIVMVGRKARRHHIQGLAMDRVAAVQVCSGGGLFEMDLVVPSVPGRRVPLLCHNRGKVLREDARRLAEFLGVPLLDHTDAGQT